MAGPSSRAPRRCGCGHPPLVLCFLCLLTLTVTFLCFGIYIRLRPVTDLGVTKDFDTVLQTLSSRRICLQRNVTDPSLSHDPLQGWSIASDQRPISVSVLASATLSPWQPCVNHSGLQIRAMASQLGTEGAATDPPLLVTVAYSWWSAQCNHSDPKCAGKYCITFTGPEAVLPQNLSSSQCSPNSRGLQLLPELYVVEAESDPSSQCYSLQYRGDQTLKAMMSPDDRTTTSNRLLMATVFCLFVTFVVLMICMTLPSKEKKTPRGR